MKLHGRSFHVVCLFFITVFTSLSCQRSLRIQFNDSPSNQTTVIQLEIPDDQFEKIKSNTRTKFYLHDPRMTFTGQELSVKDIHLRGSSSMLFRRKSFSVDLKKPLLFPTGKKMDHFYLISMCMDRSYYENVFAFKCLSLLNISHLYHQYAELWINGQPEGVYLLMQRPNDYAIEDQGAPYVLRRGAQDFVDGEKSAKETTEIQAAHYRALYQNLTKMSSDFQGEQLYEQWNRFLDVENYLRLLAFNYWVCNGDYADELYFYISGEDPEPRFHILPWDFDDIFAAEPHEGAKRKLNLIGNSLLFSGEAGLDRIIAADPFLYQMYLTHLRAVLEEISAEDLKGIFEEIYDDLHPYYSKPAVIEMSKYDQSRQTDLERLEEDMKRSYEFLIDRRRETLRLLQKKEEQ